MTPDTPNPSEIVTSIELTAKELCAELRLPPRRYWMDKAADLIEHLQRELAAANRELIAPNGKVHMLSIDLETANATIAAQQARINEAREVLLTCDAMYASYWWSQRKKAWLSTPPAESTENDNG